MKKDDTVIVATPSVSVKMTIPKEGSNARYSRMPSLWNSVYLLLEVGKDPSRGSGTKSIQIRVRRQWREGVMGQPRWDLEVFGYERGDPGYSILDSRRYELIYYPPSVHSGGRIRFLFERVRVHPGGEVYLSEGGTTLVAHFSQGIIPKYMVDRLRKIAVGSKGGKE